VTASDTVTTILIIAVPVWWIILPRSVLKFYDWLSPTRSRSAMLYNEISIRILGLIVLLVFVLANCLNAPRR
jgi:hypothetical protein